MSTQKSTSNQAGMVGLQSLYSACQAIYPDQPNPLQVTARLKYWLGGPDPLDYISMYWNPGRPELSIPPHWHYISFGLSDLHGDCRVHPIPPSSDISPDHPSGFGIELTMRVLGDPGTPPTWPAALLQRLANYVFTTGNCLLVGDHVSWHAPLDGTISNPPSAICHIIIAQDSQMTSTQTPLGKVQFVQIVGITKQELRAAQRCGGAPLLTALAKDPRCGGLWLVTDMKRKCSAEVSGLNGPSDLSGVAAHCQWEFLQENPPQPYVRGTSDLADTVKNEIKCVLQKGLSEMNASSHGTVTDDCNRKNNIPKDDCKMSTDSIKFVHIKSSTNNSYSELPSVRPVSNTKLESSIMSTDSFKMTEMENALIEDLMENENSNKLDSENYKKGDSEHQSDQCLCGTGDIDSVKNVNISQQCEMCNKERQLFPTTAAGVHIIFDKEAGSLLPLVLQGRVLHKSHFTWSRVGGGQAITVLGNGVAGALATPNAPIAALKGWLQILIPDEAARDMINQLADLEDDVEDETKPDVVKSYSFNWDSCKLSISIVPS